MTIIKILYWLFMHWIADFVLQSDEDAKNKSTKIENLLNHTFIYSLFMTGAVLCFYAPLNLSFLVIFFGFMLGSHTTIDYVTSKVNGKLWKEGKVHNFFVSIGFDQWLHYVVLFLTLNYLFH